MEILENVKVFARRQQGYDNTATFSLKTAELKVNKETVKAIQYAAGLFKVKTIDTAAG